MTDKNEYFIDDRKRIINRYIKIKRGRKIPVNSMDKAIIKINNEKLIFQKYLYISGLKINLLSTRRLCKQDLKGSFNKKTIYLKLLNGDLALKVLIKEGIYIINWIKPKLDMAFTTNKLPYRKQNVHMGLLYITSHADEDYLHELKNKHNKSDANFDNYLLWHRRFAHFGPAKLRDLHKVTTLKKQIIIPAKKGVCEVCKFMKIKKQINHQVRLRKIHLFESISINICGFLPISLSGMRYFIKIMDQQSRRA